MELHILVNIRMERRKDPASMYGKKEPNTQDNGLMINCKDTAPTNGLMAVLLLVSGKTG